MSVFLSKFAVFALLLLLLFSPYYLNGAGAVGKKKLTEKELQDLEDQWFEDEEDDPDYLTRWKKGANGERVPPKHGKSEMAFVALHKPITKDETSKWGGQMADVLNSGGVDVKAYPVEAGKVLFVVDKGFKDMMKVQKFILKQEKVVDFEWNQKKSYPVPTAEGEEEDTFDPLENLDLSGGSMEAIMARAKAEAAAAQGPVPKPPKAKDNKPKVQSASLGGAGSPIPAEIPEEED